MSEDSQELKRLKECAKSLGVKVHHKQGADAIRAIIEAERDLIASSLAKQKFIKAKGNNSELAVRKRMRSAAMREVRVIVTALNPLKTKWEGETITVANSLTGDISKYILFGKEWHIPQIVLDALKERQYQKHKEINVRRGDKTIKQKVRELKPEYNIQVLGYLSDSEMKDLAHKQSLIPEDS